MNDIARIAVLEAALKDAIAYMERLPPVPATYAQVRSMRTALNNPASPPIWEYWTPVGELALQATVEGRALTLHTSMAFARAKPIWDAMANDGLTVPRLAT